MKQAFLKFSGKKIITAAVLSASLLLNGVSGNAAVNNRIIEILSGKNSDIQLTASTNDALVFKVHINNNNADNFTLTIKNSTGDVLFSKSFNDVDFLKQFRLLKGDQDSERYYFTISSANKDLEDTYVISSAVRTVNDIEINKL